VVLTLIQNSPEHKIVEFKVHVCEKRNGWRSGIS